MLIGMLFILAGVLIALYPPLLSIIVASLLILLGITLVSFSIRFKKMSKRWDNPFMDFFVRF